MEEWIAYLLIILYLIMAIVEFVVQPINDKRLQK